MPIRVYFYSQMAIIIAMATLPVSEIFGSAIRTNILVLVRQLEDTYVSELAVLLDKSQSVVFRTVRRLENQGLIALRSVGIQRMVKLNPRFVAAPELSALLAKIATANPEYEKCLAQLRRRPRKTAKKL